jgi:hypothetical protein
MKYYFKKAGANSIKIPAQVTLKKESADNEWGAGQHFYLTFPSNFHMDCLLGDLNENGELQLDQAKLDSKHEELAEQSVIESRMLAWAVIKDSIDPSKTYDQLTDIERKVLLGQVLTDTELGLA